MIISNNFNRYKELREEYPYFIFENYSVKYTDLNICITYHFNLSDKINFNPKIEIPINNYIKADKVSSVLINNLVFHIGLIEMLSYWKATCSPEIIIKQHKIDYTQLIWLKKLYFNGLGEFFYINGIKPDYDDFVKIISMGEHDLSKQPVDLSDSNLIPLGGGKDSSLSYELLTEAEEDNMIFFLNPQHLPVGVIDVKNRKNSIVVAYREISPALLELNKKGFLNGHTPFSALLAFLSLLISALTSCKNIILSNESSANEATVANTDINHQYSKTYAFENDFRNYVRKNISESFNYFSFLRPLNELQIAFLFSGYEHFFNQFRSCNVGSKTGVWCCRCPKCLFTYIMLSPFLDDDKLIAIFGENLFENKALEPIFDQLTGKAEIKPFDCIGTIEEVNTALVMSIERRKNSGLSYLLNYYMADNLYTLYKEKDCKKILSQFNDENFLSSKHINIIKSALNKRFMLTFGEKIY